jgi:hypothetical protein
MNVLKMESICSSGNVVEETSVGENDTPGTVQDIECTICLNVIGASNKYTSECGHSFHINCIMNWYRTGHDTCPNCRSDEYTSLHFVDAMDRASCLRRQARKRKAPQRLKKAVERLRKKERKKRETWRQYNNFRKAHADSLKTLRRLNAKYYRAVNSLDKEMYTLGSMDFPGIVVPKIISTRFNTTFSDSD